jgi:hypothetical protein
MKSTSVLLPVALALAAAAASYAPHADAGTSAANATAFCQGALPAFDTEIRKRPLGVNNEGDSNAFVSCSIPIGHNPESINNAVVYLTNRNGAPVDVTCTLVDGLVADLGAGAPSYYPQTVTLPANGSGGLIWMPADFELETFSPYQNYSCNVPAGVEINLLGHDYTDAPGV